MNRLCWGHITGTGRSVRLRFRRSCGRLCHRRGRDDRGSLGGRRHIRGVGDRIGFGVEVIVAVASIIRIVTNQPGIGQVRSGDEGTSRRRGTIASMSARSSPGRPEIDDCLAFSRNRILRPQNLPWQRAC
jgi:hypothetical protein